MNARRERPGPRYQPLLQLLRTADAVWNASRAFFARWDLSPSQFNVLNLLSDQPDGLTQSELSRALIMHRSNVTGLIDRLEKRRLVQRRAHATDRRAYRVALTNDGRRLLAQILPYYYAAGEQAWGSISTTRARQLAQDLAVISETVRRIVPEAAA